MKRISFTMLKDEKAGVWQKPQTLCWEDSSVADAARNHVACSGSSKNEQRIQQLLPC